MSWTRRTSSPAKTSGTKPLTTRTTEGNYFDYPTSNDSVPSNNLINPDPGNNANFYGYNIGSPDYTTEVGEFENSESPYGTFDQGGNVWEWNEAILYGSSRGLRGGSFLNYDDILRASVSDDLYPRNEYDGVGFRVASIPEPSTLLLGSVRHGSVAAETHAPLTLGVGG